MNKFSMNLYKLLYYMIALLPLIWVKNINILGDNALPLLLIVLEVGLIYIKILDNKIRIFSIKRKYSMDQYICGFIFIYALWKIFSFLIGIFTNGMPDMEFYTTFLVVIGIYILLDCQIGKSPCFFNVLTIFGTVGSSIILLTDINGIEVKAIIDALTESNDGIYAYLLLVVILSIVNYILKEDLGKWGQLWLVPIALNMFVLLLHQKHIGNWVIVFVLLLVASFFRPRATLMKKVGILLFLFLVLWANMGLVLNYTKWFQVEAVYSLEAGVYMELVLALGGLLFFHFWDRLPQEVDLHKVSMVMMQRYFRMVTGVLGFVFLIFIAGGEAWQSLPDNGLQGFVKVLALPLSKEIAAGSSTIFNWIVEMGSVIVILFLIWFYYIGKQLLRKCGRDREENNIFFLIYILFLIELFVWEIPSNVFIAYMFMISMGNIQPKIMEVKLGNEENEKIREEVRNEKI